MIKEKIKALTAMEEKELFKDKEKNRNEILERNTKLVFFIAKKYSGQSMEQDDLINEGHIGLMIAFDKFDADKGFKFSTYAVRYIRQAISRAIYNKDRLIRLPVWTSSKLVVNKKKEVQKEKLKEFIKNTETLSINYKINAHSDKFKTLELWETLEADNTDVERNLELLNKFKYLFHKFNCLMAKERDILVLRYGLINGIPKTLKEVSVLYGVTKERIRQIEQRAIHKLEKKCKNDKEMFYD